MSLLKTAATVAVASSVHGRVQRRQQRRWAAQDAVQAPVQEAPVQPAPAAPVAAAPVAPAPVAAAPAAPVEDPMVTQLKQLAELRDAGILTEDEFVAKKAQLLGI
ncbi:MAG: SHOCT domain-containing protein [Nocardioidaceae bacterium]|nr:MAG: SHOCT domain-containing protein [Nocardioidaceae bacterium]